MYSTKETLSVFSIIGGLFLLTLLLASLSKRDHGFSISESPIANPAFEITNSSRESITFIMGEDEVDEAPFYAEATNYYRLNQQDRTEYLNDTCRTLLALRNQLELNPPQNGLPWGRINIVVHSNEWTGMEVRVLPGGRRATANRIVNAVRNELLLPLSRNIMDQQTEIVLHGCGLGKDESFTAAIRLAFGGEEKNDQPQVASSPYFISYVSDYDGEEAYNSSRLLSDSWYTFFQPGNKPTSLEIENNLIEAYPSTGMDWEDALTRNHPRFHGDSYTESFRVPVVWTMTYPSKSARPDIQDDVSKKTWIENQEMLMDKIEAMGIPKDTFNWSVQKIMYMNSNGTREAAIKAIGFSQVLCVIRGINESQTQFAAN